ncbi:HAMP domain-containing histidine kinase [Antribacter sp. KLBMP9083]|uniref:Signal transduction histidine-protein kinase/phosphatase MprB n=1 Tax=Antribacter soli TaxID=2910976 RepID=A0AA41QAX7_9MICO|nr:HAMP domain-containing sensor histidine kinase [Antribacter soli]MCF4120100.1 HAMP domain-containing histidine kinase [Antribacter soli]
MRERLRAATLWAVLVAVILLGVPTTIFGARYIYGEEVQRIADRATELSVTLERLYQADREISQETLDNAAEGLSTDIPAHVLISLPTGEELTAGEPVDGPRIDAGPPGGVTESRISVTLAVSAWPAWIKAANAMFLVLLASIAAFVAGAIVAVIQSNRLAEPFVYLAASAELLGAGQVRPRLEPSGVEEIDLVAAELARSSDRLAGRLAVERQFTADASHQLRTPLTALTMRLEEITLTSSEPDVQEEARISLEQVERLVGVVDDLLARSRKAQGGTTETVELGVIFRQQEEEWRPTFEREGRGLAVEVPAEGLDVLATPGALAQVLSTLLENSLKHGAGTTTMRARLSGTTGAVAIEVTDEGEGVPEELAGQIFERGVTSGAGTGLGLALARDLVTADGGRLELSQRTPPVFSVFLAGVPKSYDPRVLLPEGSVVSSERRRKGRRSRS